MKNPTNFGKRVETGVDPCLPNCPLDESPTTRHCQVECWHVCFYYMYLNPKCFDWHYIWSYCGDYIGVNT